MKQFRSLVVVAFTLIAHSAFACVADGPVKTAQWIHANERSFPFQTDKRDVAERKRFLSPRLYGLLAANWKCEMTQEDICALESDPWTNAQDGDELPPIKFKSLITTKATATVQMTYQFGWAGVSSEPAKTQLKFIKNAKSGCWLLDDLVGRTKDSLIEQLLHVD